ncbi:ribonuclease T2-like [Harmonia axyridis]|uniref:ribonuclease T2-like n=1 Tax=Harmonia axyridis TaxID=115357 RepID=UPI001E27994C|nr:ribonuclease T2-like [Harmonia axyridis]
MSDGDTMVDIVCYRVLAVLLVLTLCHSAKLPCDNGKDPDDDSKSSGSSNDFDRLILAQLWPVTECINWRARDPKNMCNLPKNKNAFTVHGLWPSKSGTLGPKFCKTDLQYSPNTLNPIITDMNERWTDIHAVKGRSTFWEHEWKKHGTCAQTLKPLKGVLNYFQETLRLQNQYDISQALRDRRITPGGSYKLGDIYDALIAKFKATPWITLSLSKSNGKQLLNEIRLCFNKALKLIDCRRICNENLEVDVHFLKEVP